MSSEYGASSNSDSVEDVLEGSSSHVEAEKNHRRQGRRSCVRQFLWDDDAQSSTQPARDGSETEEDPEENEDSDEEVDLEENLEEDLEQDSEDLEEELYDESLPSGSADSLLELVQAEVQQWMMADDRVSDEQTQGSQEEGASNQESSDAQVPNDVWTIPKSEWRLLKQVHRIRRTIELKAEPHKYLSSFEECLADY